MGLSFNGGKDSTVLLHIVRAAVASLERQENLLDNGSQPGHRPRRRSCAEMDASVSAAVLIFFVLAETFHTFVFERQDDFKEIDDFVEDTNRQYGLDMRRLNTDFRNGVRSLVSETRMKAIILGTRRQVTSSLCKNGTQLWKVFMAKECASQEAVLPANHDKPVLTQCAIHITGSHHPYSMQWLLHVLRAEALTAIVQAACEHSQCIPLQAVSALHQTLPSHVCPCLVRLWYLLAQSPSMSTSKRSHKMAQGGPQR